MEEKKQKKEYKPLYVKLDMDLYQMLEKYAKLTGRKKISVVDYVLRKELPKMMKKAFGDEE